MEGTLVARASRLKDVKSSRNRLSIERREFKLTKVVRMRKLRRIISPYTASTEFAYTASHVSVPEKTIVRLINVRLAPTMLTAA